jgi:hypothetical protein
MPLPNNENLNSCPDSDAVVRALQVVCVEIGGKLIVVVRVPAAGAARAGPGKLSRRWRSAAAATTRIPAAAAASPRSAAIVTRRRALELENGAASAATCAPSTHR